MKNILITGGAGYIGSHVARLLAENKNLNLTIIDSLENGFQEAIDIIKKESKSKISFIKLDLKYEKQFVRLNNQKFDGVLHFAAFLKINESVEDPLKYFENNVTGSINLLKYMKATDSKNLVFSSTCSLYSRHAKIPFTEESDILPENPYSESKYMMEKIIHWSSLAYNFRYIVLRYFNPFGVNNDWNIGYSLIPSPHLVPAAVRGALGLQDFHITCGKVNTPDGSTIRDYIHIMDLADTHKIAIDALFHGHKSDIYNVGTGKGNSVLEIIHYVKKITGKDFKSEMGKPRKGELPEVVGDTSKFQNEFNWKPKHLLEEGILSLAEWFKKRPDGYKY